MRNSRLIPNPYAKYATAVDIPGLKARRGESYHYPWVDPEKTPISARESDSTAAPGWSILVGYKVGTEGKGAGMRQQIFKLLYDDKDTGAYATSSTNAAEMSWKLDPATGKRWGRAKNNPRGARMESFARGAHFSGEPDISSFSPKIPQQYVAYTDEEMSKLARAGDVWAIALRTLDGGYAYVPEAEARRALPALRRFLESLPQERVVRSNPRGARMLSRARALNAQYDRDNYEGSSRAQLAQARRLEAQFDADTGTASARQLAHARRLEAQFDQDNYEGSSRAQLAQARLLEALFNADTGTSSRQQLAYARQLERQFDQDNYEGSTAAQLAQARMLEAEFDANDNPRSRNNPDYTKRSGFPLPPEVRDRYREAKAAGANRHDLMQLLRSLHAARTAGQSENNDTPDYSKLSNAELRTLAAKGDSRAAEQLENNEMAYQTWHSRQTKENPAEFRILLTQPGMWTANDKDTFLSLATPGFIRPVAEQRATVWSTAAEAKAAANRHLKGVMYKIVSR